MHTPPQTEVGARAALPAAGYVRAAQFVPGVLPIHENTLWKWVRSGRFPKPTRLSPRVTVWNVEDIRAWFAEQEGRANG